MQKAGVGRSLRSLTSFSNEKLADSFFELFAIQWGF